MRLSLAWFNIFKLMWMEAKLTCQTCDSKVRARLKQCRDFIHDIVGINVARRLSSKSHFKCITLYQKSCEKSGRLSLCHKINVSQCDMAPQNANSVSGVINRHLVQTRSGDTSVAQWSDVTSLGQRSQCNRFHRLREAEPVT